MREKYAEEARQRMKAGKGPDGSGGRGNKKNPEENLPQGKERGPQARDQMGKAFGVSGRSVDHARKVLENAVPEVVQAVDEGRMSVSTAAILAGVRTRTDCRPRRK